MTKLNFKRAITATMLMLAVSISANAQFGGALKKAADKAKNEVKKEASSKVTEKATEKAVEAAPASVKEQVSEAAPQQSTGKDWVTINPGDENKKSDDFTKSLAEIKKSYNKLDANLYPKGSKNYLTTFDNWREAGSGLESYENRYVDAFDIMTSPPNRARMTQALSDLLYTIPYAFALVQADPSSFSAYREFVSNKQMIEWAIENNEANGNMLEISAYSKIYDWEKEGKRIDKLHLTPIEVADRLFDAYVKRIKEQGRKPYLRAIDARYTRIIYQYVAQLPGYDANDNNSANWKNIQIDKVQVEAYEKDGLYAIALYEKPKAIALPKTYTLDEASTTAVTNSAKEKFSEKNVVKVIFLEPQWYDVKNPNYPYDIIARGTKVGIICQAADGSYEMYYRQAAQNGKSGNWSGDIRMQAPLDQPTEAVPVNYK
jgi:hypothetical protein